MLTGGSGAAVSAPTYTQQGYVTDGANIFLAVQDAYFNAVGVYNPSWQIAASSNWIGVNLTMRTLVFPARNIFRAIGPRSRTGSREVLC